MRSGSLCFRGLFKNSNNLLRALGSAVATANTLILIDISDIVDYMNSVVLTGLLAEMAGNTAGLADSHNVLTLILVAAVNNL